MAQTATQALVAHDWELWIGRTVATVTTWTQILGLGELPFPQQIPEEIDATHHQSPGRTRESITGLLPYVETEIEKQMWPGHAGDTLLNTLADLTSAGTPEEVEIEFNTDPAGTGVRRAYRGRIRAYTPTGSVGGIAMCSVAMTLFNKVTADRVIA